MPRLRHPSPAPEPCLGIGLFVFGRGGLEGMTRGPRRWREWQRPIRGHRARSAAAPLVAVEIRHVFISSSHPHPSASAFISTPGEGSRERGEREGGGGFRIRVYVCAFKSVCMSVFACMLCAGNILEIQRDERVDTDSTYLLQSWPKYKCVLLAEHMNGTPDSQTYLGYKFLTDFFHYFSFIPWYCALVLHAKGTPKHTMAAQYLLMFSFWQFQSNLLDHLAASLHSHGCADVHKHLLN